MSKRLHAHTGGCGRRFIALEVEVASCALLDQHLAAIRQRPEAQRLLDRLNRVHGSELAPSQEHAREGLGPPNAVLGRPEWGNAVGNG